ncbi:MAG: hypothetical protein A2Y10_16310 [Planctomycetes bacterium GWF2_41_51]|nr:MAG: hypothetical protein A2Y10_16310 [Planctomycetes bacterium GWF2_41_51]HBG26938.1 hypothetical protein [Phycisphaerales bacterium]
MYPKMPDFEFLCEQITAYSQFQYECGAKGVISIIKDAEKYLSKAIADLKKLPIDKKNAQKEPNKLSEIRELRSSGPRRLWEKINTEIYLNKLEGALLGRLAGCTLGASVEF